MAGVTPLVSADKPSKTRQKTVNYCAKNIAVKNSVRFRKPTTEIVTSSSTVNPNHENKKSISTEYSTNDTKSSSNKLACSKAPLIQQKQEDSKHEKEALENISSTLQQVDLLEQQLRLSTRLFSNTDYVREVMTRFIIQLNNIDTADNNKIIQSKNEGLSLIRKKIKELEENLTKIQELKPDLLKDCGDNSDGERDSEAKVPVDISSNVGQVEKPKAPKEKPNKTAKLATIEEDLEAEYNDYNGRNLELMKTIPCKTLAKLETEEMNDCHIQNQEIKTISCRTLAEPEPRRLDNCNSQNNEEMKAITCKTSAKLETKEMNDYHIQNHEIKTISCRTLAKLEPRKMDHCNPQNDEAVKAVTCQTLAKLETKGLGDCNIQNYEHVKAISVHLPEDVGSKENHRIFRTLRSLVQSYRPKTDFQVCDNLGTMGDTKEGDTKEKENQTNHNPTSEQVHMSIKRVTGPNMIVEHDIHRQTTPTTRNPFEDKPKNVEHVLDQVTTNIKEEITNIHVTCPNTDHVTDEILTAAVSQVRILIIILISIMVELPLLLIFLSLWK